jgi:putative ABC transport system permease protein
MSFFTRFASLLRQRRLDRDLDEELRAHLEMRAEDSMAEGMSDEQARRDAVLRFGNPSVIRERSRTAKLVGWLETLWQDLRYSLRVIRKQPGFSVMAIAIVAVGIGAGATLFSITETALRFGLMAPISDRWVMMRAFFPEKNQRIFTFSIPEYQQISSLNQVFEKVAFVGGAICNVFVDKLPEMTECTRVTAGAIPMTGVRPYIGRLIRPDEDVPGGPKVAVLKYELWEQRFQGNPRILGTSIRIDEENYTVIGVMPRGYDLWGGSIWLPYELHLNSDERTDDRRARVIALMRPGITESQANARLQELSLRMARDYAATHPEYRGMSLSVWNIHDAIVGFVRPALMILLSAVGLLILVSCANLGSLLLSRANVRQREMAVRAALGARRLRILRQVIVESLTLSFLGSVLGVLLAVWGVPLAVSLVPQLPNAGQARLTLASLAIALAIAFVMGILFGMAPAFYGARTNLTEAFKEGSGQAGLGGSSHKIRNLLVISEIAFSLVILTSAVLMIRTYRQLTNLDLGYRVHDLLTMEVSLPEGRYPHPPDLTQFFRKLTPRLSALPGIESAALTTGHPLMDRVVDSATQNFELEGHQGEKETANANIRVITPDYFRTTGTRLVSGRFFSAQDDADHLPVAIVNKTMAHLFWPTEGALGQRIHLGTSTGQALETSGNNRWVTIVGVVDDAKQIDIIDAPVRQEMFFPMLQRGALRGMTVMIRSKANQGTVTDAVRHAVLGLDPELPIHEVFSMEQLVSFSFGPKRLTTVLLLFFAVAGLTLVIVGLYAVMAFSVVQRTREIGVRMALGAGRTNILRMMLRQGIGLGVVGLILGLAASFGATRVLRSLFLNIDPVDPLILALVCAGLAVVIIAATYVPALRATKVDPIIALRQE